MQRVSCLNRAHGDEPCFVTMSREVEAKLLPALAAVQHWIDGHGDPDDKSSTAKVVQWLKCALVEAHKSPALKSKALELLGTGKFTRNLPYLGLFDDLQKYARDAEARQVGQPMREYFESARLGERLGSLGVQLRGGKEWRTQEVPPPPREPWEGIYEHEVVYMHVLRMVALPIDADYQALTLELARRHGGDCRTVEINGAARMWNKLQGRHDHHMLPASGRTLISTATPSRFRPLRL